MRVAVIADTHGLLRQETVDLIEGCDAVIHAGDVDTPDIYEKLKEQKPLYLVRGNNDGGWAGRLPESLRFELDKVPIFLIHNRRDIREIEEDIKLVVFGHSHKYSEEWAEGRCWLNPGSCGKRRFRLPLTMAAVTLLDGKIKAVERIDLETAENGKNISPGAECGESMPPEADRRKAVGRILRGMDKGETIAEMSLKWKLPQDFVEQVCRIRVTHPGVTAEGILNKMEVNELHGR
ncbi:metallophosphoesterase family protein [Eisenbergiella sp.]